MIDQLAEARPCEDCATMFRPTKGNLRRGWGRFCSHACYYRWRKQDTAARHAREGTPKASVRTLKPGDPIPTGTPRRYRSQHGYMVLRWKIGKYQYVEAYEHRVKLNLPEASVHHRNEVKDDNSAENLIPLSPSEHGRLHNPKQLDIQLVRQLYEAGETMPALAARFQVNSGTISRAIAEAGGQGRSLSLAVDLEAVRQLRAQGFGALRIGRLLNVSTSRINKAFRQAGL